MNIPIAKPFFDAREEEALLEPLRSGWVVQGPKVKAFEDAVCSYAAAGFARATTSCTTALHLSLVACGVEPGDEVILPSFTFIASANAIEYVGARPVFTDIDLRTFNIDAEQIEEKITPRTKAIMPVHLFGLCADMKPILEIAAKHRVRVIEDAACAIGSFYRGQHAGTMGDAGCFSFHPRKSISTGEGGMVTTNNPEIARRVEILRDHGAVMSDLAREQTNRLLLPEYTLLGYNYRMTDLQGALGVTQMQKLAYILERKRELAIRYEKEIGGLEELCTPEVPNDCLHGYQAYVCLFSAEFSSRPNPDDLSDRHRRRNALMTRLAENGVATRQGTHAVHALGYYRQKYRLDPWDFPNSWIAEHLSLALPLYPQMTAEDQSRVCGALRECLGG